MHMFPILGDRDGGLTAWRHITRLLQEPSMVNQQTGVNTEQGNTLLSRLRDGR